MKVGKGMCVFSCTETITYGLLQKIPASFSAQDGKVRWFFSGGDMQ